MRRKSRRLLIFLALLFSSAVCLTSIYFLLPVLQRDDLRLQFQKDVGTQVDPHIHFCFEDIQNSIAAYNGHLPEAIAHLLGDTRSQTLSLTELEHITESSVHFLDEQNRFILAEVYFRGCRVGSHDGRSVYPVLWIFDRNGNLWDVTQNVFLIEPLKNTLLYADGRWVFVATEVLFTDSTLQRSGIVHLVLENGKWILIGAPPKNPGYGAQFSWEANETIQYLDSYHRFRYLTRMSYEIAPCEFRPPSEGSVLVYGYKILMWDGSNYQVTETGIDHIRYGNKDITDWKGFCKTPEEIATERIARAVDLQRANPKDKFSTSLEGILWLESLNLSRLPPELFKATTMYYINLRNNQLTTLPPEIGTLVNLRFLDLSNNQLTTLPKELCQLPKLEMLNVTNNPLVDPPPDIIAKGTTAILEYMCPSIF